MARATWGGRIRTAAPIAAGALLLLIPAILNCFPFVFATDTADYLILTPRVYRSPFYQAFVALAGLRLSIWLPVIVQALLASGLIRLFLAMRGLGASRDVLIVMAVLAGFSGLPVFVGFIMPDVFTGLMFLGLFLLVFDWDRLSRSQRIGVAGAVLLAISVHLSHLVMAAGMAAAGGAFRIVERRSLGALRGAAVAGATIAAAAVAFTGYNAIVFGLPRLSPAGSVFLMANLIEHGPARDELAATCPQAGYRLCAHRHRLPRIANDLLWRDGVFTELGGFAGLREESGRIVGATLAHRPAAVIAVSARNVARALVSVAPATDIVVADRTPVIRAVIGLVYGPATQRAFDRGWQAQGRFPVALWDGLALAGLAGAAVLMGLLIARGVGRLDRTGLIFLGYAIAAYAGNALVCATISGVWDRYQARVAWLPMLAVGTLALRAWRDARAREMTAADDGRMAGE